MADIYLQVVINAATHDLSYNPEKEASRLSPGDIIGGGPAADIATLVGNDYIPNDVIGSKRIGFLFIKDVPTGVGSPVEKIRKLIQEQDGFVVKQITISRERWDSRIPGEKGPFISVPTVIDLGVNEVVLEGTVNIVVLRAKFGIKVSEVPAVPRANLLANRYLNGTWTNVKQFFYHKPEDRPVVDTDLDG